MIEAPCRDCQDKSTGCHGRCQKYIAFAAENAARREERHRLKTREGEATDYYIREQWRREGYLHEDK